MEINKTQSSEIIQQLKSKAYFKSMKNFNLKEFLFLLFGNICATLELALRKTLSIRSQTNENKFVCAYLASAQTVGLIITVASQLNKHLKSLAMSYFSHGLSISDNVIQRKYAKSFRHLLFATSTCFTHKSRLKSGVKKYTHCY